MPRIHRIARLTLVSCLLSAVAAGGDTPPERLGLRARRAAFHTSIREPPAARTPPPEPPSGVYERVRYPAPLGKNAAYVTPVRKDGKKRPAIVWIHGGLEWDISDLAWQPADRSNDQSARAFREAGMVEMLPSLRGCNDNPGDREYFLGEVDDVLAAIEFLRKRPDVDPERVYLGGHSTGATLALLVAASRPGVRAVFAFGPIARTEWYGETGTALDLADGTERVLRNPAASLGEATAPVYVIEGSEERTSMNLEALRSAAGRAPVRFLQARGADHFSTLAPITELIASRIVREARRGTRFDLTEDDLAAVLHPH